ncbi:MAG: polysaccharide deacetylase family protein [Bacteroidota bacterium]
MKKIPLILLITFISFFYGNSQILKKPIPDKLVVLSFDDAPASQYSVVAPLLQEYGFNATFFVCEFPPNYQDSTLYMNWRQIKALHEMGFEVANHTKAHSKINEQSKSEFFSELEYIEDKCDSLGIPQTINFAYPGYRLNASILNYLDEKGYVFARAGGKRAYNPLEDHPYLIPSWATNENNKEEILTALGEAKDGDIAVLTLHGVPDMEHPWVNTPPALFKEYLDYLKDNDYRVISIKDLETYIDADEAKNIIPDLSKKLKS